MASPEWPTGFPYVVGNESCLFLVTQLRRDMPPIGNLGRRPASESCLNAEGLAIRGEPLTAIGLNSLEAAIIG